MTKFRIGEINKALREVQAQLMAGDIEAKNFDMSVPVRESCATDSGDCGTAACIGGHAALLLGLENKISGDVSDFVGEADPDYKSYSGNKRSFMSPATAEKLGRLFYPSNSQLNWQNLTPTQGAVAIERYFNGSKNPWKGII